MSGPPGIGVDVKSLLKSIKGSCEKALEAFDGTRDSERLQAAADCLSEIEELIGGRKLPLYGCSRKKKVLRSIEDISLTKRRNATVSVCMA